MVSPAVQKVMYQELDRMLSLDVIEESNSSWCSPIAVVSKANGKIRLCLDARKLNEVTVKDAYPLPIIDGLLGRLKNTRFISSIDLKDAFWQIPLDEGSRDKTAFTVPGRPLYQFKVMPFGLCNAPQTLCRLMHRVIPHELHTQIFVYLDDLLVTSETFDEHIYLLHQVAGFLSKAKLTINIEKSKFLIKEISYLGYIVGDGVLKVNPDKVSAITAYSKPKNVRQIRRFLGMTGWYRRFISRYSDIAEPLTGLLKKNKKFVWSAAADKSFNDLKIALSTAPVLCHPDYTQHFYIQCDASSTGVGGVLFQKTSSDDERPVAYFSQKLNPAQRNYSITELECLAAVLSVKKFRQYVEGLPFTVITDHASLKWLMGQRDLSGRLARWSLKLQAFNFSIEYRKGKDNLVPDALSRNYADDDVEIKLVNEIVEPFIVNLESDAFADQNYQTLIQNLTNNPGIKTNLKIVNGRLFINTSGLDKFNLSTDIPIWKLYVPELLRIEIMKHAHCSPTSAHLGIDKCLEKIRRYYHWPGLTKDVHNFINSCDICKECKATNSLTRPPMGNYHEVVRPWQKIFIDFIGPFPRSRNGNLYILVVLDQMSRFVFAEPMRDATSRNVIKFLEDRVFHVFSVPEFVVSDNGKQFTSNMFKDFLIKYGTKHIFTPKYHPQSNTSERVNRSIVAAIRSYVGENHGNWDLNLNSIGSALRNVIHSSTNQSPHFLVFGQHHINHGSEYELIQILKNIDDREIHMSNSDRLTSTQKETLNCLRKAYERSSQTYNLRSRLRNFQIGQKVYARTFYLSNAANKISAKLMPKFKKAFIKKFVGNVAYELTDQNGKSMGIYHAKDIRT